MMSKFTQMLAGIRNHLRRNRRLRRPRQSPASAEVLESRLLLSTTNTIDDGDAGFVVSSPWLHVAGYGYEADAKAATAGDLKTAQWRFTSLPAGEYEIRTTWLRAGDRTEQAPYRFLNSSGDELGSVLINQKLNPAGEIIGGRPFQLIGTVIVQDGVLTVELSNQDISPGAVIADAVQIRQVSAPTDNNPPVISPQNFTVQENTPNGTSVGTVDASDPDVGDTITYSIVSGNTNDAFAIDTGTGQLTVNSAAALDFETTPHFLLRVQVTDDGEPNLSSLATMTIDLSDVNETPTVTLRNTVSEIHDNANTSSPIRIADIEVLDDALGTNVVSLSGGDAAHFELSGDSLFLKADTVLDAATKSTYQVTVEVNDDGLPGSPDASAAHILTVTATPVGPVVATIDDGDAGFVESSPWIHVAGYGYEADAKVATAGDLKTAQWRFNGLPSGEYEIRTTWLRGGDRTEQAPYRFLNSSGDELGSVLINQKLNPAGEIIGGRPFQLIGTAIVQDGVLTVELSNQNIGPGAVIADAVQIRQVSAPTDNNPPVISPQNFTVAENTPNGNTIGTVNASDPDVGDTLTYSIVSGNTNDAFAIDTGTGQLTVNSAAALDFETTPQFLLRVQVTDDGDPNLSSLATMTIDLSDLNEAPTVTLRNTVSEIHDNADTSSRIRIADIEVLDDALGTNVVSLSGADAAHFELSGDSLFLKANTVLDAATKSTFHVTVEVNDDGLPGSPDASAAHILTVTATRVGPVIKTVDDGDTGFVESPAWVHVAGYGYESDAKVTTAGDLKTAEWRFNGLPSGEYQIWTTWLRGGDRTDNAPYRFLNSSGDEIGSAIINQRLNPDGEVIGNRPFQLIGTVTVQDGVLTVELSNRNINPGAVIADAVQIRQVSTATDNNPPTIGAQSFTLAENSSIGTVVGTVSASDPDVGDTLTYSIVSGNTGDAFAIDAGIGQLTVNSAAALDFESTPQFLLRVQVTDDGDPALSATATVTIQLTDVNEAPVVQPIGKITLTHGRPDRTLVLDEYFDDVDDLVLTYSLVSYDSQLVTAAIENGELKLTGVDGQAGDTLVVVKATDTGGLSVSASISVEVDRPTLATLTELHYSEVSDQIVEYHGQNTFVIETNFDESSRIEVESTNDSILDANEITIEALGSGQHRVIVRHRTENFGLAFVRFRAQETVFAEVAIIVTPANPDAPTDEVNLDYEHSTETTESGGLRSTRKFNDRYLARQIGRGAIKPETAFSLIRPTTRNDMSVVHSLSNSSATHVLERGGQNSQLTGRVVVSAEISTGAGVSFNPLVHTSAGYSLGELFTDEMLRSVRDSYGQWNAATAVNYVSTAASIAGLFTPAAPFAVAALIVSSGSGVIAAGARTAFIADASVFDGEYQKLEGFLNSVSVTGAFAQKAAFYGAMAFTGPLSGTAYALANTRNIGDMISGASGFVNLASSFTGNKADASNAAQIRAFRHVLTEATTFSNATAEITEQWASLGERSLAEGDGSFTESELAVIRQTALNHRVAEQLIIDADTVFTDVTEGDNPEYVPPGSDPGVPQDPDLQEGIGENGDQQNAINDVAKEAGKDHLTVANIVGVGKKVYDIVKSVQGITKQVGQLFEAASSDAGDYTDNDGETYNMFASQSRSGDGGRDIINTGYLADEVFAKGGDDRISTLDGDDFINGGEGRNTYFAGPGADTIHDGSGGSAISAGEGRDTIYPGAGNDLIEAGTGHDTIVFDVSDIGNNLLVDPSRSGLLRFTQVAVEDIVLRKDGYDLEIILPSTSGRVSNSVKFNRYFEHDAAGWELSDSLGNTYSLYELTGRITSYEALEAAFRSRGNATHPIYPEGFNHVRSVTDASGRFTAHVAEDRRLLRDNSTVAEPGLVITFEGDSSLEGWMSRNQFGSLEIANELFTALLPSFSLEAETRVTVIGVGEGGLIAQWFSAIASTRGPDFVNTHLINSPDISGLISQVVRSDIEEIIDGENVVVASGFDEYIQGYRVLSTNFIVNHKDWVSRVGLWAGNDETYASWKAFDFDHDPLANQNALAQLVDVQAAHMPASEVLDFSKLQISDMDLTQVRGVVSLIELDDFSQDFANIDVVLNGEEYDSTTNASIVMFDGVENDRDFDFNEDTKVMRKLLLELMREDPQAVEQDDVFSLKLDFQAANQLGDHLAPFHNPVTELTIYTPEASGLDKYGWESLVGIKDGKDKGRASSLERDSVKVRDATFIVDLTGQNAGPGTYNISITVGDREEIQESLHININGYPADRVSTMPGDFLTRTYQISTLDSQLRISFEDIGGQNDYFSVNGVTVEKVNYRSIIGLSESLDNDPSVVVLTQSYELPETSAGIEIYKEALKAAAMAAATAGVGAVLGATSLGANLAAQVGGSLATGAAGTQGAIATAAATSTALSTKAAIWAGVKASLGSALQSSVLGSLVTSVPQNFISDPTARGTLSGATSIFLGARGIDSAGEKLDDHGNLVQQRDLLKQVQGGLTAINGGLTIANTSAAAIRGGETPGNTAPWIYEVVNSLATMTQRYRLGKLNTAFVPVDLDEVEDAIAEGKTPKQLLKRWQGSRDFLVLDWVPTRDKLTEIDVDEHRDYVKRTSKVLKKLLEAYAEHIQEQSPETELDVLFIGHGAGYEVNRETANRLNVSDSADAFDYVKFVTLDPYASSQDAFTWYHPELTNIVDRVDNIYQTEKVDSSLWLAALTSPVVLIGSDPGGSDLYHGGSDLGGLDGREGGGAAGFYNRQARVFDLASTDELLRFRHWDTNKVELSTAELTDIEFSPDGRLVAASGKDGMVTVRYVDDALQPDPETGKLPYRAGDVKFIVWGQESKVRSVAFMQMEVEGIWRDYLLTISAANNPENTDIDKNKVLLTDVETGLPVWQGKDVAGTQVEASPSGRIIVSTDSKGQAKVWKRAGDSVTFDPLPNLLDAHTGPNSDYIADVLVINDEYFVTAGLDGRMKLFRITDDGGQWVQTEIFDNQTEGRVRNLDYDPYNGLLAVGAGQELSLWRFNQVLGILAPFAPDGQQAPPKFSIHDHVGDIQGVAFSKPSFLLDSNGFYSGDRTITRSDGTVLTVPRREGAGDIDLALLPGFLTDNDLPSSYSGLKLLTGGEDKTLFLYTLDSLNIGSIREENVLSGSMLPVRELTISADGRRVAVVGEDNIDGNDGGPVKDIDVTAALDDRLGWKFSELFLQGRREHNAVPQQYIYDIVEQKGESYFWMRNSGNANRPGDLDKSKNLALPPNKRDNIDGVDIAPIDLYLRPGKQIEIFPLQWLLEVDRKDFSVNQETLVLGDVVDINDSERVIGTIKLKRSDSGQIRPNTFVFEAADNLDYTLVEANQFVGKFHFDINGPTDIDGNAREIRDAEITFRIINHKPTTYRDIVNLHPNREEIDLRPRANDYDFDNDDFGIIPVPSTWQPLVFGNEEVARYRRHPDPDHNRGVDIEALVSEDRLTTLLEEQRASDETAGRPVKDYISVEFDYQVKEDRYKSISTGTVEVRLQLQAGPENVRFSELGADQVLIEWDPVTWSANKYVIESYETRDGVLDWYKHSTNSDVDGNQADSLRIKIIPNTDYWFRVVAKNTNSDREHASYEGTDRALMLYVPATNYVGPGSVSMESLGPAQIEVRWEKVFWDVDRYRIDLHQLVVGDDGLPLRGSDGSYQFVDGKSKFDVVQKRDGLRVVFKRLDTSKPYLAIVTAKNTDGSVEKPTSAAVPVFTGERQLPAGIKDERIGPEKMRISWGTVDYADKYRVVAIDPITLERIPSEIQNADNSRKTNDLVLEGLSESSTYVIIVEARTKKTKEWITLIDDDPQTPILPNRDILAEDISAAVNAGVASMYIIPSDFSHSITVPSLQGQFVTAEFTFLNFSRQSTAVTATDGTIQFPSSNSNVQTLPAAFGDDGDGAIVYRFIARERSDQLGTLYWEVQVGAELSEARAFSTPAFLAAEPSDSGELLRKSDDSLPKQLKIDWITPFWDVNRHRIEIFNYDEATGAETPVPGVPAKTKYLSELTGKNRTHTFKGLTPATQYLVRLTTVGDGKTRQTERLLSTDAQESPSEVRAEYVTLRSFEAVWNELRWNVKAYRVSFAEIGADGRPDESTRDYRGANADKTSKLVEGLKSGVEYSFTVEAQNQEGDWIPNTNIKSVKTLAFELPSDVYLTSPGNAPHQIQLDWSSVASKETDSGFRFGADSVTVRWRKSATTGNGESNSLPGSASSYTITGLTRGQDYEVWLEFRANGIGVPLELRTERNEPLLTTPATPPTEIAFSDETRGSFRVTWKLPDGNDHDWYNATVSLDDGATWRNTQRSNGGSGNGMNRDLTTVVLSKYQKGDGTYTSFKADTTYLVRIAAVYDNGDARAFSNESGDAVTTADYVTPSNVRGSTPTETTILLEWDFSDPIGLPDKFAIEYSKNGGATWPYKEGAGNTLTSKLIDNLEPGESYIFRVTSEYASGEERTSANSDPVSTSNLQLLLTNIVVDGKRKATVHWQALAAEPHALSIEVLQLDENGNTVGTWTTPSGGNIVNDKSRTSKQITELLPGTSYRVRLVAANSQGNRTESGELTFATEAYPPITGLGVSLPTKQGATVEWTRLETLDSDANVTENVIEVFLNNVLVANPATGSGSGNKHSFKLTGLQPGLAYEFRIVAFNGNVKLSESARMEFFTLVDGLTVDEITQTTARANWTQFAGGGATDYRVKVLIPGTNSVVRQKVVSIGSGIRRTTVDGLAAQTNYEMIVEVLKNNTVLSYSNRASFRTADAATAPTDVQLSRDKWRALTVSWTSPSNWTPSNYTVRVYTTSGQLVSQTSTSNTSREVTGLTVGTAYYATVTANGTQGNLTSHPSGTLSTFGLAAPTSFNVTQSSNVLTFNWNHYLVPGLPSTGFNYRIERRGGDGQWKTVNNTPISGSTGSASQSFNIQRQNSKNPLDRGKTYDFRVVAVYNNNLEYSNTFSWTIL